MSYIIPRGKFRGRRDYRPIRCPTGWKHRYPTMRCENCTHMPFAPSKLRWEYMNRRDLKLLSETEEDDDGKLSPSCYLIAELTQGLDNLLYDLSRIEQETSIDDVENYDSGGERICNHGDNDENVNDDEQEPTTQFPQQVKQVEDKPVKVPRLRRVNRLSQKFRQRYTTDLYRKGH